MVARALRLGYQILRANFDRKAAPFKLTFCITFRCQSRCKTCNIWQMKPENELSFSEIERFVSKPNGFSWVNLTGGEVTLRDDLVDICRLFSKHSPLFLLNFVSNGLAPKLILEKAKEIVSLPIPKIMIGLSLDGPESVNDDIRGVQGDWKKVVEAYRGLRELAKKHRHFRTYLGYTLSPLNHESFSDFYATLKTEIPDLTPHDIHLNFFHQSSHYYHLEGEKTLAPSSVATIENVEKLRNRFSLNPVDFLESEYLRLAKQWLKTGKTPVPCHAVRTSCFVDSWGNVFPCTIYDKKLGSLRENDYDLNRILNSPLADEARSDAEKLHCPNCWTPCEAYQMILSNLFKAKAPE